MSEGLNQHEASVRIGIAQQTLSNYEVGRSRIPVDILVTMMRALRVPALDWLLDLRPWDSKTVQTPRLLAQLNAIARLPVARRRAVFDRLDALLLEDLESARDIRAVT